MNVSPFAALAETASSRRNDLMRYVQNLERRIAKLDAYPSLFLLVVPLAIVEPLKLATVFIAGDGHWVTGAIAMLFAYGVSLLLTHWLFQIVKPKLLTLPRFAALWARFIAARDKTCNRFGRHGEKPVSGS